MAMRIAVFAAMPQETGPIFRLYPGWRRFAAEPLPIAVHQSREKDILLVQTGIGGKSARQAARQVATGERGETIVDLMLSVGFAGAISSDLTLGQVVSCSELASPDDASGTCAVRFQCRRHSDQLALPSDFFADYAIDPACFVTVQRLTPKAELRRLVPWAPAVTEMESCAVAEVAHELGVPFIGLRAVSDEASQEIDLDPDFLTDQSGKVSLFKLMSPIHSWPSLAKSLLVLHRGSRVAGRNLARMLAKLFALPNEELQALGTRLHMLDQAQREGDEPLGR